jgi:hypothetical protein
VPSFGTTTEFTLPAGETASIILDLHGDEFSLEPEQESQPTTIGFVGGARIDGTPVALSRFPEITLSAPLQAELEVPPLSWTTVPEAARHEVELRIRVGAPDDTVAGLIAPDEATLGRPSPQVRTLTLGRGVSFATAWEPGLWKRHAPRFLSAARRVTTIPWGEVWPAIVSNARTKDLNWVPVEFRVTAYDRHGAVAGQSDWGAVYIVMPEE